MPDGSALYLVVNSDLTNEIPEESLNAYSSFLLNALSRPNRSKRQHLLVTIHLQRYFLLDFMAHYGYQNLSDNRQEEWFENTHGEHLFQLSQLTLVSAHIRGHLKSYSIRRLHATPLANLMKERESIWPQQAAQLIIFCLSSTTPHHTTLEQNRKLLKKSLEKGPPIFLT